MLIPVWGGFALADWLAGFDRKFVALIIVVITGLLFGIILPHIILRWLFALYALGRGTEGLSALEWGRYRWLKARWLALPAIRSYRRMTVATLIETAQTDDWGELLEPDDR